MDGLVGELIIIYLLQGYDMNGRKIELIRDDSRSAHLHRGRDPLAQQVVGQGKLEGQEAHGKDEVG